MARYHGPACKLCRREGLKLFLKGAKCATDKCVFNERKNPPGPPSKRRPKLIGYAAQLREKQKVKRVYGVLEKQFRNYFKQSQRMKGIAGENLLQLLELRLDNVLYRMGVASSRAQARNFISQGHVLVNNKRVDLASFRVSLEDSITVSEKMQSNVLVEANTELAASMGLIPDWLELNENGKVAVVVGMPSREHIDIPIREQVIIELYSK